MREGYILSSNGRRQATPFNRARLGNILGGRNHFVPPKHVLRQARRQLFTQHIDDAVFSTHISAHQLLGVEAMKSLSRFVPTDLMAMANEIVIDGEVIKTRHGNNETRQALYAAADDMLEALKAARDVLSRAVEVLPVDDVLGKVSLVLAKVGDAPRWTEKQIEDARNDLLALHDPRSLTYADNVYAMSLVKKYQMSLQELVRLIGRPVITQTVQWL